MTAWGLSRLLALGLTGMFTYFTLVLSSPHSLFGFYLFFLVLNCFLYSHYVMGLAATARQVKTLSGFSRGRWLLISALSVALISIAIGPEMGFWWFGIHFALSESYSRALFEGRDFFTVNEGPRKTFRIFHGFFLTAAYFFATQHTLEYVTIFQGLRIYLSPELFLGVFVTSAIFYFGFLIWKWREIFPGQSARQVTTAYVFPELVLIAFATFSALYRLHWVAVVLYHITFWLVAPLLNPTRVQSLRRVMVSYLLPSLAIFLLCAYLYPRFLTGVPASPSEYGYNPNAQPFLGYNPIVFTHAANRFIHGTMNWGTVHILLSLFISALNPAVFRRLSTPDRSDPLIR